MKWRRCGDTHWHCGADYGWSPGSPYSWSLRAFWVADNLLALSGLSDSLSLGILDTEGSATEWRRCAPLTGISDLSLRLTLEAGLWGRHWHQELRPASGCGLESRGRTQGLEKQDVWEKILSFCREVVIQYWCQHPTCLQWRLGMSWYQTRDTGDLDTPRVSAATCFG